MCLIFGLALQHVNSTYHYSVFSVYITINFLAKSNQHKAEKVLVNSLHNQ